VNDNYYNKSQNWYRKSVCVVINKMDVIEVAGGDHGHTDAGKSLVTEHAKDWLGAQPP
jgi:hypothetical protein